ncbi:MAG TPA: DUF4268 domain-containing protein [Bacteroidales bacterium]|jgi:hypothetical protein|nr:DUF4268 domain-containing protein [Bacteroidales bacterium]
MELGILKSIEPRQSWENEARDFTPWLANNIAELNKALGLELEVENTEVCAGPYFADILAKDTSTDNYVVIENQLDKTNHDHLGKVITYASVLDAKTIIWIATEFTEEHKKALDWLNEHSNDEISFFGVQLELWQIDNSKAAVKFNVISKPNEAVRQAAISKTYENLSDNEKFLLDFWTNFKERLTKIKKIYSLQIPKPENRFYVNLGKSHIHLTSICNTDNNTVGVYIFISKKIADTIYPFLESIKAEIESAIGQELIWNPNPDNKDKIILLQHTTDFKSEEKIDEALNWLVEYTIKFRETFSRFVKQAPR